MNELIRVAQLPIIEEQLRTLSAEIDEKVNLAKALVCTEDTVKEVKKVRSELAKQFAELEEQRKAVKKAVLAPYERFESVYKEFVSDKYKSADTALKTKIDDVQNEIKSNKESTVKEYFDEYKQAVGIGWLTFDMAGLNITLSVTEKKLKEQVKGFVDRVSNDLSVIEMQEDSTEILVEYQKTINLSQSMQIVKDRKAQLERMKAAEAERKATEALKEEKATAVEVLSVPKIEQILTATFKVKGTLEQLKELKVFLEKGGYYYEC